jgi:hypothetical protein
VAQAQTALFKHLSPYRAVNTLHLGYKNQTVNAVSGTSAHSFIKSPSPYRAVNTFHLGYIYQSVFAVSGTSADSLI